MFLTHPPREEIKRRNVGERGGHRIGPSRPKQRRVKCVSRNSRRVLAQCRGVSLCSNNTFGSGKRYNCSHVTVGHRCHCLFSKGKGPQNFETWQSTLDTCLCIIAFDFPNGVRVSWSPYSAIMMIYSSPCYVKRCFITEYPSLNAIFISFDVW